MTGSDNRQRAAAAAFDAKRRAPLPIRGARLNVQAEFRRLARRDLGAWLEYHTDGIAARLEDIRADAARLRDPQLTQYQANHGRTPANVLSVEELRALPAFKTLQALCRKSNVSLTLTATANNFKIDIDVCRPFTPPAKPAALNA